MKKIYLTLIGFLLLSAAESQNVSTDFHYPVKRGSEAWMQIKTYDERKAISQIPDKTISNLSTSALLRAVLDYPLLPDIFVYKSYQFGLEQLRSNFNAFDSLMNRKDVFESMRAAYAAIDLSSVDSIKQIYDVGEFMFKVGVLELFIAQKEIIGNLSANQINTLSSGIIKAISNKSDHFDKYSAFGLTTTAWLLGRLLGDKISSKDLDFGVFIAQGYLISPTNAMKLKSLAESYLNTQY